MSAVTFSYLERGLHRPTADTALKLARWLGWSVERVMEAAIQDSSPTDTAAPSAGFSFTTPIQPGLDEDAVWRQRLDAVLGDLPRNVLDILRYGFTEMFNNAVEHSGGTTVTVSMMRKEGQVHLNIRDDGVGIFHRIREAFNLEDDHHTILELSKGKLTTRPENHTGQGIFFTSRMMDFFAILSGRTSFARRRGGRDICLFDQDEDVAGTAISMRLSVHAAHTSKEVFDEYSDIHGEEYGFIKTYLLVEICRYGDHDPVSRSEAKRLVARLEDFRNVVLDFSGISWIGQAFADEVFRVFVSRHPDVALHVLGASADVVRMIRGTRWAGLIED